ALSAATRRGRTALRGPSPGAGIDWLRGNRLASAFQPPRQVSCFDLFKWRCRRANRAGIFMTNDLILHVKALKEIEGQHPVPALWAKAFSDAGGDANRAKAQYMKLRV